MAELVILIVGGGLFWLGFHFGSKSERVGFTRTAWMHDATDRQKQNFIAGLPPGPGDDGVT
jgi:hypothetical protein